MSPCQCGHPGHGVYPCPACACRITIPVDIVDQTVPFSYILNRDPLVLGSWGSASGDDRLGSVNVAGPTMGWTAPEPIEPPEPLPKADVAGPIIAFRQWHAKSDGLLWSVTRAVKWPVGQPLRVRDVKSLDATPAGFARSCHGMYAAKRVDHLDYGQTDSRIVTGRVALWGKVIEHEHGYRAEYAYPFELFEPVAPMSGFPFRPDIRILKIAKTYGIRAVKEASA